MRALGARRDDENSNSENVLKEHAQQVQRAKRPHNPDALVSRLAFALVRPPGHHAGCDSTPGHHAEGFCFYNSVAVAAGVALDSGLAERVCIIDWDVHHGTGTQSIYWEDSRVLYISLHRYGGRWYPQTGSIKEEGAGRGRGYNVNIAWPEDGLTDSDYLAAFRLIVMPILEEFGPCLMLVSAGFDAGEGDVQGKMRVSPSGFGAFTRELMGLGVPTVRRCSVLCEGTPLHRARSTSRAVASSPRCGLCRRCIPRTGRRYARRVATSIPFSTRLAKRTPRHIEFRAESSLRQRRRCVGKVRVPV